MECQEERDVEGKVYRKGKLRSIPPMFLRPLATAALPIVRADATLHPPSASRFRQGWSSAMQQQQHRCAAGFDVLMSPWVEMSREGSLRRCVPVTTPVQCPGKALVEKSESSVGRDDLSRQGED